MQPGANPLGIYSIVNHVLTVRCKCPGAAPGALMTTRSRIVRLIYGVKYNTGKYVLRAKLQESFADCKIVVVNFAK